MNVSDINGSKPPLPNYGNQRSSNVYGAAAADGQGFRYGEGLPIAGARMRTGERSGSMADIFSS